MHVNINTGSGVRTIFVYKGLARNPEIENTYVWVLPNIWRLGQVRDNKFRKNVTNDKLLNAVKCQSFYHFWVIKGNNRGYYPCPRLGLISLKYIATFKNRKFRQV